MSNTKLWDVIGEYAHCVGEYMHATKKDVVQASAALKIARTNLVAVIGERVEPDPSTDAYDLTGELQNAD